MILSETSHRPWPLPSQPWILRMEWHDLLFLHWPVPAEWLRPLIPPGLELQIFEGAAWLGVVPFYMRGTRPRLVPPIPGFSDFPELNVRTYVTAENKPGVWFFSLDAANPLAVRGARIGFHLPYFDARMRVQKEGNRIHYSSTRTDRRQQTADGRENDFQQSAAGGQRSAEATFIGRYHPTGSIYRSQSGTLEHWLTERYCLYSADKHGRIWRADIHHLPWPLQPATADIDLNTMTHPLGFDLPDIPPLTHYAHYLDVVAWLIHRVRT